MNKTLVNLAVSIFFCFVLVETSANASSTIKVTARVIDETGKPIREADVKVWYMLPGKSGIGTDDKYDSGQTDSEGLFTSTGTSFMPQTTIEAKKPGYYESGEIVKFKSRSFLFNRWDPWNPTVEVVLKKKRNQVPMYMKGTDDLKVPVFDKAIGYDLEKGDMVAPYGSGAVSDFVFTFHANDRAYSDYECNFTLTFSNEHDGIQEYFFDSKNQSLYKWPFEAPESGYVCKLSKEKSMIPGRGYKSNEKNNVHYLFRIRTKVDKDGKIIGGLYGKIEKEFEFDPKGAIFFGYYLNPDGTRNLEEAPTKNLFKKK